MGVVDQVQVVLVLAVLLYRTCGFFFFLTLAPRKNAPICSSYFSADYLAHRTTPSTLTKAPCQCSTRLLSQQRSSSPPRKYLRKSLRFERRDGATQRSGTGRLIGGKRRMHWDCPRGLRIDVKLFGENGGDGRGWSRGLYIWRCIDTCTDLLPSIADFGRLGVNNDVIYCNDTKERGNKYPRTGCPADN